MAAAITSPRLLALLERHDFVLREHLREDKRSFLLAVTRLFNDYDLPFVVAGSLAVQLYYAGSRSAGDVEIISLRQPFELLKKDAPWAKYGFELVSERGSITKLRHDASNMEVAINVDTRFARLAEAYETELIEGYPVRFTAPTMLALAKLRTQRSNWPRDPVKRIQDRGDLMALIRTHPEIPDVLRIDPLTTDEMRSILDEVLRQLAGPHSDDLPPEEDEGPDKPAD